MMVATLIPATRTMLNFTTRCACLHRAMVCGRSMRSLDMMHMSAVRAARAMQPSPIATPTEAAAIAFESLMPSPTISVRAPFASLASTHARLSEGSIDAWKRARPRLWATSVAASGASPVSMATKHRSVRSSSTACCALGRSVSFRAMPSSRDPSMTTAMHVASPFLALKAAKLERAPSPMPSPSKTLSLPAKTRAQEPPPTSTSPRTPTPSRFLKRRTSGSPPFS
mmetsp:Transcript_142515/g.355217  ORF Transcript_142515/g.355217 Transcript_142515/m.355217 type:complete len:226 (-) Transcript_142515:632-1309(-)